MLVAPKVILYARHACGNQRVQYLARAIDKKSPDTTYDRWKKIKERIISLLSFRFEYPLYSMLYIYSSISLLLVQTNTNKNYAHEKRRKIVRRISHRRSLWIRHRLHNGRVCWTDRSEQMRCFSKMMNNNCNSLRRAISVTASTNSANEVKKKKENQRDRQSRRLVTVIGLTTDTTRECAQRVGDSTTLPCTSSVHVA